MVNAWKLWLENLSILSFVFFVISKYLVTWKTANNHICFCIILQEWRRLSWASAARPDRAMASARARTLLTTHWADRSTCAQSVGTGRVANTMESTAARAARASSSALSEKTFPTPAARTKTASSTSANATDANTAGKSSAHLKCNF